MRQLLLPILTAVAISLASCQKSNEQEMEINSVRTGSATEITEISAKLHGDVRLEKNSDGVRFGFIYSKDKNPKYNEGNDVWVREIDGATHYSTVITGLSPDTDYYYRSVIAIGLYLKYGDIKSFRTKTFAATVQTLDATDVSETKATLNGSLSVNSSNEMTKSVWFLYSDTATTLDELRTKGIKEPSTLNEDGTFNEALFDLKCGRIIFDRL